MMQMLHSASHLLDPSNSGAAVIPFCNYICRCHIFFKTKYYLILCTLAEKQPRKGEKSKTSHRIQDLCNTHTQQRTGIQNIES